MRPAGTVGVLTGRQWGCFRVVGTTLTAVSADGGAVVGTLRLEQEDEEEAEEDRLAEFEEEDTPAADRVPTLYRAVSCALDGTVLYVPEAAASSPPPCRCLLTGGTALPPGRDWFKVCGSPLVALSRRPPCAIVLDPSSPEERWVDLDPDPRGVAVTCGGTELVVAYADRVRVWDLESEAWVPDSEVAVTGDPDMEIMDVAAAGEVVALLLVHSRSRALSVHAWADWAKGGPGETVYPVLAFGLPVRDEQAGVTVADGGDVWVHTEAGGLWLRLSFKQEAWW